MDVTLDLSIDVLRRSPAVLQALLQGVAQPWARGTEGPNTFSPFDVVGHLIDGEETDWIPRARIILAFAAVAVLMAGSAPGVATDAGRPQHLIYPHGRIVQEQQSARPL